MARLKTFALEKTLLRERNNKPQTRRKCLQITYPTKDRYPVYIKNSQKHSVKKKKGNQSNLKINKRLEQILYQRGHKDDK